MSSLKPVKSFFSLKRSSPYLINFLTILSQILMRLTILIIFTTPDIHLHSSLYTVNDFLKNEQETLTKIKNTFSYDDILKLIDDIEEGELEKKHDKVALKQINNFLITMAVQGMISNEQEKTALYDDILELLHSQENSPKNNFSFAPKKNYTFLPIGISDELEIIRCKSWVNKKWKQTQKFVKKHKKAIIIGAVIVVATTAVVSAVIVSSTALAFGATAADSNSENKNQYKLKENELQNQKLKSEKNQFLTESNNKEQTIIKSIVEENIINFKQTIAEKNLSEISNSSEALENAILEEKARNLGSALAHQTLDGISELTLCVPQLLEEIKDIGQLLLPDNFLHLYTENETKPIKNFENLVTAGHEKIDQIFSTELSYLFTPEAKEAKDEFSIGIIPFPGSFGFEVFNVTKLADAGKIIDRAGFTKAGRSLMKHGYREESVFIKPFGNPVQINEQGQKILETILNHPEKKVVYKKTINFGEVMDVYAPGIGGARFNSSGEMIGFLEP